MAKDIDFVLFLRLCVKRNLYKIGSMPVYHTRKPLNALSPNLVRTCMCETV